MCEKSPVVPVSGEHFLESRLAELEARAASGSACQVVFDLDNTLFDTRRRTAWIAQAFDDAHATTHFKALTIDRVGFDALETCDRMGLVAGAARDGFARFWEEKFWDGASFVHDAPIEPVLQWARLAARVGAEVRFLTGRIDALREPTAKQLSGVGFETPTRDALWMKPDLGTSTLPFKESMLRQAMRCGWLGWYVTEGRDEIAHLQRTMPGGPWVLLDCSLQDGGPAVADHTPMLARTF